MDERLTITVSELRSAMNRAFDAAEKQFGPTVDLDADFYWVIAARDSFEMETAPTSPIGVGQLSDDVDEVRSFLARPPDETVLWHDLEHLVGILRRLAALDLPDGAA